MSVTDDIVEEIARRCKLDNEKTYSRIIIREDYVEGFAAEFADEIEAKLKVKGISIGP